MSMKTVGLVGLGVGLVAAIGGGIWWYLRRKKENEAPSEPKPQRVTPSKPPRAVDGEDDETDSRARGHFADPDDLPPALAKAVREKFGMPGEVWPPSDETIDNLTTDNVVVVAVESEPVPGYEKSRAELILARVRSVEKTIVRGRVIGPVDYAEHIGNHAGHGFRVGDLIDIPRSKVVVAAHDTAPKREGFNSKGHAAGVYDPSTETKQTYTVRPSTPYDLVLPYRTDELEWAIDRDSVKMTRIGSKGSYEQIMFSEDSMRGPVSVRALDRDPKEGVILIGRWDFHINP